MRYYYNDVEQHLDETESNLSDDTVIEHIEMDIEKRKQELNKLQMKVEYLKRLMKARLPIELKHIIDCLRAGSACPAGQSP